MTNKTTYDLVEFLRKSAKLREVSMASLIRETAKRTGLDFKEVENLVYLNEKRVSKQRPTLEALAYLFGTDIFSETEIVIPEKMTPKQLRSKLFATRKFKKE